VLGIIGGSGLYAMAELAQARWQRVSTPFGDPSDEVLVGELEGTPVAFLPRHGRGHRIGPSDINYRANIAALKQIGVTDVVSVSAVGSLRDDLSPGTFVMVDQFVDRTVSRPRTFFGPGMVVHVGLAHPVCARLRQALTATAAVQGLPHRQGGTYLVIEGPQFSTLAESRLYRQWGCDVIGMTNMPEARLAREAELCYATVAMVTDYDCWHPEHGTFSVETILGVLAANVERARALIRGVAPRLATHPAPCPSGCDRALATAVATAPEARTPWTSLP
jgi:5'-methylthioadenosine phosphorylase